MKPLPWFTTTGIRWSQDPRMLAVRADAEFETPFGVLKYWALFDGRKVTRRIKRLCTKLAKERVRRFVDHARSRIRRWRPCELPAK